MLQAKPALKLANIWDFMYEEQPSAFLLERYYRRKRNPMQLFYCDLNLSSVLPKGV